MIKYAFERAIEEQIGQQLIVAALGYIKAKADQEKHTNEWRDNGYGLAGKDEMFLAEKVKEGYMAQIEQLAHKLWNIEKAANGKDKYMEVSRESTIPTPWWPAHTSYGPDEG